MKLKHCPFCGANNGIGVTEGNDKLNRYDDMVTCSVCNASNSYDWWQSRYDDWRSDGWPEGDVLVLWDGRVFTGRLCDGYVDLDKEGIMPRLEKCKWKPLPEGGES